MPSSDPVFSDLLASKGDAYTKLSWKMGNYSKMAGVNRNGEPEA